MIAADLVSLDLPILKTSDSGDFAIEMMEEFKVTHLPIVNNTEFLGLISEADILDLNEPDEALGAHKLSLSRPYVLNNAHIFEVIKHVTRQKLSLIPVLDSKHDYVGAITLQTLVENFDKLISTETPGGVIVLELNIHDYSLSEIARIVESNDAKILNLYISSETDTTKLDVTIKINRTDLTRILQSFLRYNYNVKASFHESSFGEDLKERFDSFMNYLNI